MAQTDEKKNTESKWIWRDNSGWVQYEDEVSKEIEDAMQDYISKYPGKGLKLQIPLTKGTWFSNKNNNYSVNLQYTESGLNSLIQVNHITGYERQIKRIPSLDSLKLIKPKVYELKKDEKIKTFARQKFKDGKNSEDVWFWRDDSGWKAYDAETQKQIEIAYFNLHKVINLKEGFFASQIGVYKVEMDHKKGKAIQINAVTKNARKLHRQPQKYDSQISLPLTDQQLDIIEKHFDTLIKKSKKSSNKNKNSYGFNPSSLLSFLSGNKIIQNNNNINNFIQNNISNKNNYQDDYSDNYNDDDEEDYNIPKNVPVHENVPLDKMDWKQYFTFLSRKKFQKLEHPHDRRCKICFCDFEKDEFKFEEDEEVSENKNDKSSIDETENPKILKLENKENSDKDIEMSLSQKQKNNSEDQDIDIIDKSNKNNEKNIQENEKNIENCNEKNIENKDENNKVSESVAVGLSKCIGGGHYFHANCILEWLGRKGQCFMCHTRYAALIGPQPPGSFSVGKSKTEHCAGYENAGVWHLNFSFSGGVQTKHHINPGQQYFGDSRYAVFPDTRDGREAMELGRIAFKQKLIFTVGRSLTLKTDNRIVWNGIHFKSSPYGGHAAHGYPDETYFERFKDELKTKGIDENSLTQQQKKFIETGKIPKDNAFHKIFVK